MTRHQVSLFVPFLIALIILGLMLLRFYKTKQFWGYKKKDTSVKIAHTRFVRSLPEYKKARRRYNALLVLAMLLFVVALGSLSFLMSRPVNITESTEEKENRDIMLCLDVSGSMDAYITELLSYFKTLIGKMDGERFGITIFDGTYATLSPLSDDYAALDEVLSEIATNKVFNIYANALRRNGSSQIGVGLAGCIGAFDKLGEAQRSRSIILATDNKSAEPATIELIQAAQYAKDNDISVYGLNTEDARSEEDLENAADYEQKDVAVDFREAVILTGGSYYTLKTADGATSSIPEIVDQIMAQEAAKYDGAGQLVYNDTPEIAAIISAISVLIFVFIIWRLHL